MQFLTFFDLPVYRLSPEKYYRERSSFVDDILYPKDSPYSEERRAKHKADPSLASWTREPFVRLFGGCWEYNEIIGYIQLHFLGTQVRGEYIAVDAKRIVRTRKKVFSFQTHKLVPEVEIRKPYDREAISAAVRRYVDYCREKLPRRYIDTSRFDVIAEHVDWESLFNSPSNMERAI